MAPEPDQLSNFLSIPTGTQLSAGERADAIADAEAAAATGEGEPEAESPLTVALRGADVLVPVGVSIEEALARTTDMAIVAHPDDLEFLALPAIGACMGDPERWFTGIVCTDGAGSERSGRYAELSPEELADVRRDEQRRAAVVGEYSALIQLGVTSPDTRTPEGNRALRERVAVLLDVARPANCYTHDLFDRHGTHVAVAAAAVRALRSLPADGRPSRVAGCESWRSLEWLPEPARVVLDASPYSELGERLAAVFESQLAGKRYDVAAEGRRRANATFLDPHEPDRAEQVILAMDLTPIVRDDEIDPMAFVAATIDRFRDGATEALAPFFSAP